MNIEIKNIKVNLAFSEETTCFTADIFVNGFKTGYARNDGQGGCTNIQSYEHKFGILCEAEAFAKTLPSTTHKFSKTTMVIESDLEGVVDQAIDDHVNAKDKIKFEAKLQKAMVCNIIFGVPNSGKVSSIGYGKKPLRGIVMTNRVQVQSLVDRVRTELKVGEVILNTNLTELGLK